MYSNSGERNKKRQLITLVETNRLLWDKTAADFNNRVVKNKKWQDVAKHLGIPTDKLRRTWENLRDQYRRDLKRELKCGVKSKWRFYDEMSFIRPMVRIKEYSNGHSESDSDNETMNEDFCHETFTTIRANNFAASPTTSAEVAPIQESNEIQESIAKRCKVLKTENEKSQQLVIIQEQQSELQEFENFLSHNVQEELSKCDSSAELHAIESAEVKVEVDSDYEATSNITAEACVSTSVPTTTNRTITTRRHIQNYPVKTESSARVTNYRETENFETYDEDYHFVMSLLPSLREVVHKRKLPLRMNLMNLITQELERNENA